MKLKRFAIAVALSGLLLASCEQSNIPGAAQVTISGRVLALDGHPLPSQKVSLAKELDLAQLVGGTALGVTTLGIICATKGAPAICNQVRTTTTNSDGTYGFSLSGADTQGVVGQALTFDVVVELPPGGGEGSGPGSRESFVVQAQNVSLPDLTFWHPTMTFTQSKLSWTKIDATATYIADFIDSGGSPVWQTDGVQSPLQVDARVLEDSHGLAFVVAQGHDSQSSLGAAITKFSQTLPYVSNAGKPMSRGDACQLLPPASQVINAFTSGAAISCDFTGGRLGGIPGPTIPPCGGVGCAQALTTQAIVDLGAPASLGAVVVRGCAAPCQVQLSADSQGWFYGQTTNSAYQLLDFGSKRYMRYISVGMQFPPQVWQISVWPPGPPSNAAGSVSSLPAISPTPSSAAVSVPVPGPTASTSSGSGSGGLFTALLLILVLIACLTVLTIYLLKKHNRFGQP